MKKNTIEAAVKALNLSEKKVFTMKELDAICAKSNRSLHEVMHYLRFER